MHVHILGIAGSFMASLALLARGLGHTVSGADQNVYPPMSTQLDEQGIHWREGYDPAALDPPPDTVVIGNALSRGNASVEAVLEHGLPYTSGAQWIADTVLPGRAVLAVAGTHGKTTTSSMLAWILDQAGLAPGFLIGGIPENFGVSARLGTGRPFVIEADEYDTAFFDKRSKFVHYRPRIAILNNLEYDHADIFPDLAAIQRQFHHLVRSVPAGGRLIVNAHDKALAEVLAMGAWTPVETFAADGQGVKADWRVRALNAEASHFEVLRGERSLGEVHWSLPGQHNMLNGVAAIAAAAAAGVKPALAISALAAFRNAKRRLEVRGVVNGVTVYDDFAHHPTAIAATLEALRARIGTQRLIAALEPRSNTMKLGVHRDVLGSSLVLADRVHLFKPADLTWNLERVLKVLDGRGQMHTRVETIVETIVADARPGDHVLIMSNGAFGGIHARLLERLGQSNPSAGLAGKPVSVQSD
ncbi:MAG: UDP-N-acetylmuramate:L-alanyl-gamma-D-glutamyl-meso-diaminopimelate ligase [Pseudomonadota bacterium]